MGEEGRSWEASLDKREYAPDIAATSKALGCMVLRFMSFAIMDLQCMRTYRSVFGHRGKMWGKMSLAIPLHQRIANPNNLASFWLYPEG